MKKHHDSTQPPPNSSSDIDLVKLHWETRNTLAELLLLDGRKNKDYFIERFWRGLKDGPWELSVTLAAFLQYGCWDDLFRFDPESLIDDFFDYYADSASDTTIVIANSLALCCDLSGYGIHGWNGFFFAVHRKKYNLLPYLLLGRSDPNFRSSDDEWDSPLDVAIRRDLPNYVEGLLVLGANPSQKNPQSDLTAYDLAVKCKSEKSLEILKRWSSFSTQEHR